MNRRSRLPVGIDSFEKIRNNDYYYVDKTKLIEQLIYDGNKINLFTRPRSFGKTLSMNMLKCFFEIGADPNLFNGLYISKNKEICSKYLGKFPVIYITLNNVMGLNVDEAKRRLMYVVSDVACKYYFLNDSDKLCDDDKQIYGRLCEVVCGKYEMDDDLLNSSICLLTNLLCKYYDKKVIVIIDEYDMPLNIASQIGYYDKMKSVLNDFLKETFHSNKYIEFALLTGRCVDLKEVDKLNIFSVVEERYADLFGFTKEEVKRMFEYYGLQDNLEIAKKWYGGRCFGHKEIYCPWDINNYVATAKDHPTVRPSAYWVDSSSNYLLRKLMDCADKKTINEIEKLVIGKTLQTYTLSGIMLLVLIVFNEYLNYNKMIVFTLCGVLFIEPPSISTLIFNKDWQNYRPNTQIQAIDDYFEYEYNGEKMAVFAQTDMRDLSLIGYLADEKKENITYYATLAKGEYERFDAAIKNNEFALVCTRDDALVELWKKYSDAEPYNMSLYKINRNGDTITLELIQTWDDFK